MNCYAVFHNNRQLRVFPYDVRIAGDWTRAEKLAKDFADSNAKHGYPCEVELFHMCDVGKLVYKTP